MSAQDREEGPSSGPVGTGAQTAPTIEEEPLPESPHAPTQIQDLRVTGTVLRPRANDVSYDWAAGGGCIYATSGNAFTVFNTPLFLPQGSEITNLRMYYDDTSTSSMAGWFSIYDLYGSLIQEWSVVSIGDTGNGFNDTSINHVVDYGSYSYVLNWRPNDTGSDMQLCGFRVFYDPVLPDAPTLLSPEDGDATNDATPTLSWDPVAGAGQYQLQVDNNNDFSSPEIDEQVDATDFTPGSVLAEETYYWRVRARDPVYNWGPWSSEWSFEIDLTPPGPPTLVSPEDGAALNDEMPLLDWDSVAGANVYRVQVDNNADFSSPEINVMGAATEHTPASSLAEDVYSWRASAQDSAGNWGPWSDVRTFEIDLTPPDPPTLLSPADGDSTSDTTPLFEWSSVADGNQYRIHVSENAGFTSIVINEAMNGTSFTPVSELAYGPYYWRVRARDSAENWSAWSSVWTVEIEAVTYLPIIFR